MVKTNRGFTLYEVMLVIAILGAVVMLAPRLIIQGVRYFRLEGAKITLQREDRTLTDLLQRFLRDAKASSVVIDQINSPQQPPYSRLSFTTIQGKTIQFYQQGSQLIESTNGGKTVLSNNLDLVSFSYPRSDDPTLISMAVTLKDATVQGQFQILELNIRKIHLMNP